MRCFRSLINCAEFFCLGGMFATARQSGSAWSWWFIAFLTALVLDLGTGVVWSFIEGWRKAKAQRERM